MAFLIYFIHMTIKINQNIL